MLCDAKTEQIQRLALKRGIYSLSEENMVDWAIGGA